MEPATLTVSAHVIIDSICRCYFANVWRGHACSTSKHNNLLPLAVAVLWESKLSAARLTSSNWSALEQNHHAWAGSRSVQEEHECCTLQPELSESLNARQSTQAITTHAVFWLNNEQ